MPEQIVVKTLEEKYQKKFVIKTSNFSSETGNYHITASPEDDDDLIFQVEHNPKKDHVNDFYPYALWKMQGDQYINGLIEEWESNFVINTGVKCRMEFDPTDIPSFEDILENSPEELNLNIFLYLFSEPNKKALADILILDETLRPKGIKKVGFSIGFYDAISVKDKNLDELEFGFNAQSEESFEVTNEEHFLGLIKYRIDQKNESSPSSEDFLGILNENSQSLKFHKL